MIDKPATTGENGSAAVRQGGTARGGGRLARSASWHADPAIVAWVGLVALVVLLLGYSLAVPQPRTVVLSGSPFDMPVPLHRLGPPD